MSGFKPIDHRTILRGAGGTAIVAWFLFVPCISASGQNAARTLELNVENYFTIREALTCPKDESGWREIPWRPNLGEAIVEARKKNKPILLWMMNGHPCGMTWFNGVKDRQLAWTDAQVRELVEKHFIPAADEVDRLQRGNDMGSRFFQSIAQRSFSRLRTTQGTYIVSPGGVLIDFGNVIAPAEMKSFLENGAKKFNALPKSKQLGRSLIDNGAKSSYPKDGLVLSVTLHKLYSRQPRTTREKIGIVEWNADFAWFDKDEARQFLPSNPGKGDKHAIPEKLIQRLARFHFTDTVRAFADVYPRRCVKEAKLTATVVAVTEKVVSLRFDGKVRTSQDDAPSTGRLRRKPQRGYDAKLLGHAKFDLVKERFVAFDLVAFGTNRGGGIRAGFEDPVKMGVILELAKEGPVYQVEPNHLSKYEWWDVGASHDWVLTPWISSVSVGQRSFESLQGRTWPRKDPPMAVAFNTKIDNQQLTFYADKHSPDTAPFKDRETHTRWSLAGRGVDGKLRGKQLKWVDSAQCRWYAWSAEYPDTELYKP